MAGERERGEGTAGRAREKERRGTEASGRRLALRNDRGLTHTRARWTLLERAMCTSDAISAMRGGWRVTAAAAAAAAVHQWNPNGPRNGRVSETGEAENLWRGTHGCGRGAGASAGATGSGSVQDSRHLGGHGARGARNTTRKNNGPRYRTWVSALKTQLGHVTAGPPFPDAPPGHPASA